MTTHEAGKLLQAYEQSIRAYESAQRQYLEVSQQSGTAHAETYKQYRDRIQEEICTRRAQLFDANPSETE